VDIPFGNVFNPPPLLPLAKQQKFRPFTSKGFAKILMCGRKIRGQVSADLPKIKDLNMKL
jgi:hypothetical protein